MNNQKIKWSDIAFGDKKIINDLNAIFIAPSREISKKRFIQIVKKYLPVGNIVIGSTDSEFIDDFENQSQFKTFRISEVKDVIEKINASDSHHKVYILECKQSDTVHILKKNKFRRVLIINGSWHYSFHTRPEYYALISRNIPFEYISPFTDEDEARRYALDRDKSVDLVVDNALDDSDMMKLANEYSKKSFDNSFQTGVVLGKKIGDKYKPVIGSFNKTVPYQTFAWHFGALREKNLTVGGDLTHYDTIHAETMLIIDSQKNGIDLTGASLFINLLPCPNCARTLCETGISEIVYSLDHSDGYAVALLEKAGKTVRRLVVSDINDRKE